MFWSLIGYMFGGWILVLLGNLEAYNKSHPSVSRKDSYWNYMSENLLYLGSGIISMIILTNLINQGALPFIFNYFIDVDLNKFIPLDKVNVVNKVLSFGIGFNLDFVVNLFRRIKKPTISEK